MSSPFGSDRLQADDAERLDTSGTGMGTVLMTNLSRSPDVCDTQSDFYDTTKPSATIDSEAQRKKQKNKKRNQRRANNKKKQRVDVLIQDSDESNSGDSQKNSNEKDKRKSQRATVETEDEDDDEGAARSKDHQSKHQKKEDAGEQEIQFKTRQDLIDDVILAYAGYQPAPSTSEAQQARERLRILRDPETHHRVIFSTWPRDPKSKNALTPTNTLPGKATPNGYQLWGASMFDFFYTQRMPEVENVLTTTTGSKMLAWVKEHGEEDYEGAKDMVEWAKREKDPHIIKPCDITRLITDGEFIQRNAAKRTEEGQDIELFPRKYPIENVFTADTYPAGWSRAPFSKSFMLPVARPPMLQDYIPQHLLPKRLVVHDPCNLLAASGEMEGVPKPKKFRHTYKLHSSIGHSERRDADEAAMLEQAEKEKEILDKFLVDPHSRNPLPPGFSAIFPSDDPDTKPGPCKPLIYFVLPPPSTRLPAKEAHLFLDIDHSKGQGNHSFVYNAVLELPRTLLIPPALCHECIDDDLEEQLEKAFNPDGSAIDPKFNEKTGKLVERKIVREPIISSLDGSADKYVLDEGSTGTALIYEGPYQVLRSRVWPQNPEEGPYCEHMKKTEIYPLTTKVKVAAKISVQGDNHLRREARNYQRFPRHFFEHWSGYNIVPPIKHPVPVAPIVPQFYGYYVLDKEVEGESSGSGPTPYLSSILLLEDCGTPIEVPELSADDKDECASLIYRFNDAGWVHGSVYPRNILVQSGPLDKWPLERMLAPTLGWKSSSYRLIDFGRSFHADDVSESNRLEGLKNDDRTTNEWYRDGKPFGLS